MKTDTLADRLPSPPPPLAAPRPFDRLAERLVRARLDGLVHGRLELQAHGQTTHYGHADGPAPAGVPAARLEVLDPRAFAAIAFGGSVGAGEAYMHGHWRTDDLTALIRLMLQNRAVLDGMEAGTARWKAPLRNLLHWAARNTLGGSRRNVRAHYDIGNDFFALFLDPTMMYSCAVFDRPGMSLEEASIAKLDRICRKLALQPGDEVIEIGTGWGGFAMHAARHYGARVTTTTISREQHALAAQRIAAAGLQDRITLLEMDYRRLEGRYDKLVSIEMIEAVGHHYYGAFFERCARLLKDDGLMLLQAITIADPLYEAARDSVDFIKRHIFPGCCIPSIGALCNAVARASDLRLVDLEDIGPHYATTLRRWRQNLFANLPKVHALGYNDTFVRMWEFYLCYCEGGFAERTLGDAQMLLAKPAAKPAVGGAR